MSKITTTNEEIDQEFHTELKCSICNLSILSGKALKIGNSYFHIEHLVCSICSKKIVGEFVQFENLFWCKKCTKIKKRICKQCNNKIDTEFCLFADQNFYHETHFYCSICQCKIINTKDQTKKFGKLPTGNNETIYICYECLKKVAKNICSGCGYLINNGDYYVKTKSGIWHNKCFICSECNVSLLTNSHFCEYDKLLYCTLHMPKDVEVVKDEEEEDDDDDDDDNNNDNDKDNNENENN